MDHNRRHLEAMVPHHHHPAATVRRQARKVDKMDTVLVDHQLVSVVAMAIHLAVQIHRLHWVNSMQQMEAINTKSSYKPRTLDSI